MNSAYQSPETKPVHISFSHIEYSQYMLIFANIIILAIIRHISKSIELNIPYSIFPLTCGLICGIGSLYSPWMFQMTALAKQLVGAEQSMYLPLIIFSTAFCIDVHTFLKSLHQILIISIPVSFICALLVGSVMRLVIDIQWDFTDGLLMGVLFCAIYPFGILHWLKETGTQTKSVTVLLEGETLIATIFCIFMYTTLTFHIRGWIVHWYQFAMGLIRIIFFGIPIGYIIGVIGCCLIRTTYNDGLHLALITLIVCYTSFYFCESVASTGILSCLISGIMLGIERASLPGEVERFATDVWKVLALIMNGIIFLITGIIIPQVLSTKVSPKEYMLVFVTYLICNISRFLSFLLFSPFLGRIGYGITFHNMVICVWGGIKNPVIISLAFSLMETYPESKARIFFLHVSSVYFLFILINGTLFPTMLRLLNLSQLSMSRQVNMNNCMKYILQARERTIAILKMDRFLSDANWPLVTNATSLKHPYKKKVTNLNDEQNSEDEEEYFMGYRFTICPDCKKNIVNEPSQKEMKEMTKEAKMRILKLRKIFYSRRYECGLLTKDGVRMAHQSIEVAMDSEDKVVETEGLIKLFHKENTFFRFILNRFMFFLKAKEDDNKLPKDRCRLFCYHIIHHVSFIVFMHFMTIVNMAIVIYHLVAMPRVHSDNYYILYGCNAFILVLFFIEFFLKILGYSWGFLWQHGVKRYFRSFWDIIDFIVLVTVFVSLIINTFGIIFKSFGESSEYDYTLYILRTLRLLRVLCLLRMLGWYKDFVPKIMKDFDLKIDKFRLMGCELGKNYISGEEEILENLRNIVENDKIRDSIRHNIEDEKLKVTKIFGSAQKDRPWVAITVKTKLAIGGVLNCMKEDINELKTSGWMDDLEYSKLLKSLSDRYRKATSIKTVPPLAPKIIFNEVVWMGDDAKITKFLYENATTKKFDPGDRICIENELSEGIYILISGLFLLNYTVREKVIDKLLESGVLPVVDYVSCSKFEVNSLEYLIPGNTLGELSTLTERPYNCTIVAETHSQVFVLRREVIKHAAELDPDPINGLESRIWKAIGFPIAVSLLMNVTAYRSFTIQKIEYIIERAFIPNISSIKVFIVNEMMEDVLLIEGVAVDLNTRDVFTGPCYIPRSVQKLILPKSSTLNMEVEVETKLLIIPSKDYDEYEIMVSEEEICEMVSDSATRCLQHIVQDRFAKRKISKQRRKGPAHMKGSRDSSMLTKSKITFATSEAEDNVNEEKQKD